jgi:hypothetical protein
MERLKSSMKTLGKLTMDTYSKRFLDLLRYIPYLKDDKVRIQSFLNGLPQCYQDRIVFDESKTLEDTIRKVKFSYDQSKHRKEPLRDWKRKDKTRFQKKGFKPYQYKNSKKGDQFGHPRRSMHQQKFPS